MHTSSINGIYHFADAVKQLVLLLFSFLFSFLFFKTTSSCRLLEVSLVNLSIMRNHIRVGVISVNINVRKYSLLFQMWSYTTVINGLCAGRTVISPPSLLILGVKTFMVDCRLLLSMSNNYLKCG